MGAKRFRFILNLLLSCVMIGTIEAAWMPTGGPEGAKVNTLADFGRFTFAGTSKDGVFRSSDGGETWVPAGKGIPATEVHCFAMDGKRMFAGTARGAYVSSDSGGSWSLLGGDFPVNSLVVRGKDLYAGSSQVYHSGDSGWTWHACSQPYSVRLPMALIGNRVFVGAEGGVYRTDLGSDSLSPLPGLNIDFPIVSLLTRNGALYAGSSRGVFLSLDQGDTWSGLTSQLTLEFPGLLAVDESAIYIHVAGQGVSRSLDQGKTWGVLPQTDKFALNSVLAKGTRILLSTYSPGLMRSMNEGASWERADRGFSTSVLSILPVGRGVLAATSYAAIYSGQGIGDSWSLIHAEDYPVSSYIRLASTGSAIFWGAGSKSTDAGATWTPIKMSFKSLVGDGDTLFFISGDQGVSRSFDGGSVWVNANAGLPYYVIMVKSAMPVPLARFPINELAMFRGMIFAATDSGVYLSRDHGSSWKPSNQGLESDALGHGFPSQHLGAVGPVVLVATDHGLYRSTDSGSNWTRADTGYSVNKYSVRALASAGNAIFAGTKGGIFLSSDYGVTWSLFSEGLPEVPINSLAVGDGYLYCGTEGKGVWARPIGDVPIGIRAPQANPGAFSLAGSRVVCGRPRIGFIAPGAGKVRLRVYDPEGKLVATVTEVLPSSGYHETGFAIPSRGSGTYFLRLEGFGQTVIGKIRL